MATKTYYSKSDISISVLVNGKGLHLSFIPVSGGGSVYTVEDEKIQCAIEKHHNFGKLFKLRSEQKVEKVEKKLKGKTAKADVETDAEGSSEGNDGAETPENDGKSQITISCPDDAKDYLADKFGISRTAMKTVKAIKAIAESKNIEFIGI